MQIFLQPENARHTSFVLTKLDQKEEIIWSETLWYQHCGIVLKLLACKTHKTCNITLKNTFLEKIKKALHYFECLPLYLEIVKELEKTFSLQRMPMFVRPQPYHIRLLNPVLDPEFFPEEVDQKDKNEFHCKKIMKIEKKKEKKRRKVIIFFLQKTTNFCKSFFLISY